MCDVEFTATRPAMTSAATQTVPRRTAGHSPTVWRGFTDCAFPVRGRGASLGCFGPVVSLSWSAPEGRLFVAGVLAGVDRRQGARRTDPQENLLMGVALLQLRHLSDGRVCAPVILAEWGSIPPGWFPRRR